MNTRFDSTLEINNNSFSSISKSSGSINKETGQLQDNLTQSLAEEEYLNNSNNNSTTNSSVDYKFIVGYGVPQPEVTSTDTIIIIFMISLWAYSILMTYKAWYKILASDQGVFTCHFSLCRKVKYRARQKTNCTRELAKGILSNGLQNSLKEPIIVTTKVEVTGVEIGEVERGHTSLSACDTAVATPNHISILHDEQETNQNPQNHSHTTTLSLNTGSLIRGKIPSHCHSSITSIENECTLSIEELNDPHELRYYKESVCSTPDLESTPRSTRLTHTAARNNGQPGEGGDQSISLCSGNKRRQKYVSCRKPVKSDLEVVQVHQEAEAVCNRSEVCSNQVPACQGTKESCLQMEKCHNIESCDQIKLCQRTENACFKEQGCHNTKACIQKQGCHNSESCNQKQGCHNTEACHDAQRCHNTEACNQEKGCHKLGNNHVGNHEGQLASYGSLRTFVLEDDLVK